MIRINAKKRCIPLVLTSVMLPIMVDYAWAVGLGQIKVYSALGQPFHAEIPVYRDQGRQSLAPEQLTARVADMETHRRRGLTSPAGFQGIKIEVVTKPAGSLSIKLTSRDPIKEPIVDFLVQLQWPNGESIKEVTALLDPPRQIPESTTAVEAPINNENALSKAIEPKTTSPAGHSAWVPGSEYGPVGPDETLMQVARNIRGDSQIPVHTVMQKIFHRNPKAFTNHDINQLRVGAWLTVPDLYAPTPPSKAKKRTALRVSPKFWASETSYGPTTAGESLWDIAQRLHGDKPAEINAWMQAVAKRNPGAFIGRNTNRLMAGVVLIVPGSAPSLQEETQVIEAAPSVASEPAAAAEPAAVSEPAAVAEPVAAAKPAAVAESAMVTEPVAAAEPATVAEPAAAAVTAAPLTAQKPEEPSEAAEMAPPASKPAKTDVAAEEPEIESSSSRSWWLGGLFVMSVGPAIFWFRRSRSTHTVPAKSKRIRNWINPALQRVATIAAGLRPAKSNRNWINPARPPATAKESDEASQQAVLVNPTAFPDPAQKTDIFDPPGSTPPLSLNEPSDLKHARKSTSNNSLGEAAAYMAHGDYKNAQATIEAAIAQNPRNDGHKAMLLAIYTASGQHNKASALSSQLLNQRPPVSEEIRKRIEIIRSSVAVAQRLGVG